MQEFIFAFTIGLIVTTTISAFVPAIGVFQQIGLDLATLTNLDPRAYLDQQRDLGPVREGALRHLDLLNLAGIVTFPSFHACSAVLYAWALWPVWWMRPFALLANGAMMASTPVDGGHYFIDLIASIVVAVLAIVAARAVSRWLGARLSLRNRTGNRRLPKLPKPGQYRIPLCAALAGALRRPLPEKHEDQQKDDRHRQPGDEDRALPGCA
ncbi:MAG: phosphatase PAP2 family protein [Xanthobacteraceae bacterium]